MPCPRPRRPPRRRPTNRVPNDRTGAGQAQESHRVCLGAIVGAHGVKGRVRIKSFTEIPDDVGGYGPVSDEAGERAFRLRVTGVIKGVVVAELEGVATREAAEALKGTRLYVAREGLPEPEDGEYYHEDLLGLLVELESGENLGEVAAVHDFGSGDVLEVNQQEGRGSVLLPFTHAIVPVVDLDAGRLVVAPPPGLLPDNRVDAVKKPDGVEKKDRGRQARKAKGPRND